jgi:hypothetical protein
MKVLIRGYANDEHCEVSIPCLCLDLDAERARSWLARVALASKLHASEPELYSLDFWECAGEFFDILDLDESVEGADAVIESIEAEEIVVLEPGTPVYAEVASKLERTKFATPEPGMRVRTELDMLEVTEDAVVRCAMIKHTSTRLETVQITVDTLGKFAGGLKVTIVE